MRKYSEDAKTSNISSMLNTYFVASDIQSTTNLDAKVQQPVIESACGMGLIKMEPDGNGGFQYRITPNGEEYRDS